MKFPYIQFRGRFLPIIPIKISSNVKKELVGAYVDSGAGYSVFHSWIAEDLDIKLEDGKVDYLTVGDGSQIKVYLHELMAEIAGQEFEATIGFSRHLGVGFNVIGQKDIFDQFIICFDRSEKIIEFQLKSR